MASLTQSFMILLMCWTLTGQATGKVVSNNVRDFMEVYNGDIDNKDQIQAGHTDHDLLMVRNAPVEVHSLGEDPVVYTEESDNNSLNLMNLGVVKEDSEGIITVTLYNFTDTTQYKPFTYDFTNMSNVNLEHLRADTSCVATFRRVGKGIFFGEWPVCSRVVDGKHPKYSLLYSCKTVSAVIPLNSKESSTGESYDYKIRKRYPLKNTPPGYISPCDQKE